MHKSCIILSTISKSCSICFVASFQTALYGLRRNEFLTNETFVLVSYLKVLTIWAYLTGKSGVGSNHKETLCTLQFHLWVSAWGCLNHFHLRVLPSIPLLKPASSSSSLNSSGSIFSSLAFFSLAASRFSFSIFWNE